MVLVVPFFPSSREMCRFISSKHSPPDSNRLSQADCYKLTFCILVMFLRMESCVLVRTVTVHLRILKVDNNICSFVYYHHLNIGNKMGIHNLMFKFFNDFSNEKIHIMDAYFQMKHDNCLRVAEYTKRKLLVLLQRIMEL